MFFTVMAEPLAVRFPFHNWVIVCPLANVHLTVHAVMALVPAVTVTSPWNPLGYWLTTLYVAEQAPGAGGGVVVGGGDETGGGVVVGGGVVGGGVDRGGCDVVGGGLAPTGGTRPGLTIEYFFWSTVY